LSENQDLTDKERNREIKSIYKRAGLLSKKKIDIKYVVSKKGGRGKRPAMGQKEKGPYRLVDKRLKKDKVPMKKKAKLQKSNKKTKTPQKKSYKR
jgi:AdoMet-dependent rRNA methyltransferase SPB1